MNPCCGVFKSFLWCWPFVCFCIRFFLPEGLSRFDIPSYSTLSLIKTWWTKFQAHHIPWNPDLYFFTRYSPPWILILAKVLQHHRSMLRLSTRTSRHRPLTLAAQSGFRVQSSRGISLRPKPTQTRLQFWSALGQRLFPYLKPASPLRTNKGCLLKEQLLAAWSLNPINFNTFLPSCHIDPTKNPKSLKPLTLIP